MRDINAVAAPWEDTPNLLTRSFELFSSDSVQHISAFLGEPPGNTRTALGVIVPAIFGALLQKIEGRQNAVAFDIVQAARNSVPGSAPTGEFLDSRSSLAELAKTGYVFSNRLFGLRTRSVESFIAMMSGIRRGSSTLLLSLSAPIVLSFLERQYRGASRDDLCEALLRQRRAMSAFAPVGLNELLGAAVEAPPPVVEPGTSWLSEAAQSFRVLFTQLFAKQNQ